MHTREGQLWQIKLLTSFVEAIDVALATPGLAVAHRDLVLQVSGRALADNSHFFAIVTGQSAGAMAAGGVYASEDRQHESENSDDLHASICDTPTGVLV